MIEAATAQGRRLHLRLAVDYSGRDAIVAAAQRAAGRAMGPEAFAQLVTDDGVRSRWTGRPHRRRAAAQRLSAVGACVRRAALRRDRRPEFRAVSLERTVASYHGAERRLADSPAARRSSVSAGCGAVHGAMRTGAPN